MAVPRPLTSGPKSFSVGYSAPRFPPLCIRSGLWGSRSARFLGSRRGQRGDSLENRSPLSKTGHFLMGQTSFLHLSYSRKYRLCGPSAILPQELPLGSTSIMTPPRRRSQQGWPNHSLVNHLVGAFWVPAARNSPGGRIGGLCSGNDPADAPSSDRPPPMEISSERTLLSLQSTRELFLLFTSDFACGGQRSKKQNSPAPQVLSWGTSARAEGLWLVSRKHCSGRSRAPSADK